MLKRLSGLVVGLLLGASVVAVEAAPLTGGFSITGNFLPVIGATGASSTLGLATGLDFINFFGSAATPGVAGTAVVNSANGAFAPLIGTAGAIRDFTFSGAGSANYPNTPLLAFQSYPVGALTFDLLSIGVTFQSSSALVLAGSGLFSMTGYSPTAGLFTFTGNGSNNTFSFSASQSIPEPASLLALAVGLLAGGGYLRRRMYA